ncbi:cAMP-regulated D2 protein-like [Amphiura filiformis]|uniref:cAMP-regulated D2 protein-like n=1 Tax=Amphiura filiformis TaxID=82378 RepID=UPI003B217DAD
MFLLGSLTFLALHVLVLCQNKSALSSSLLSTDKPVPIPTKPTEGQPLANTTYGIVQGVILNNGARGFLGVPYAAPPVGPLRWQPPQRPANWDMYNATHQPPGCPQICNDPIDTCPLFYQEDCLYLNIFTPPKINEFSNLPVMIFLHGGDFLSGGIPSILCDGRLLTLLTNTVVVTTNYRLGALGYMTTSCFRGQSCLTGNYGFMDQLAAMQFVHENIVAFGGDPNKVTLFGQSAGAQAVSLHLTNSKSDRYFQQAIIESSPFTIPYRHRTSSALQGDLTTALLNCLPGDLNCLRKRSAKDVIAAGTKAGNTVALDLFGPLQLFQPWGPVIDGSIITTHPLTAFRDGQFQRKPLLIGTVTEEGRIYSWELFPKKPTLFKVNVYLSLLFGIRQTLEISREYNFTEFDDLREPVSTVVTDFIFACSTFNGSRYISLYNESQVFHYIYDHAFSFTSVWGPNYTECYGHVCHGSELPLLWRSQSLRGFNFTEEEQQLADAMNNYWSNFVHTGNPNDNSWKTKSKISDFMRTSDPNKNDWNTKSKNRDKFLTWPPYKVDNGWQSILFQTSRNKLLSNWREEFCKFFDDIGYISK